jgi:hypothetical protein
MMAAQPARNASPHQDGAPCYSIKRNFRLFSIR